MIGLWARADFAVLLPDTSGPAAVAALDRLQLNLARPMRYSREGDALRLHVVFAVAELTAGVSPKTLLFHVRQALEQATREGKNFALYQLPDPLAAGEGSRPAAQG